MLGSTAAVRFFVYFCCCCCLVFTSLALLAFDHHLLCVPLWMLINMVNPVIILYNLINQIVDFPQWIPDCDTAVLLFWIYIKGLLEYMFCSYLPFINFHIYIYIYIYSFYNNISILSGEVSFIFMVFSCLS